MIYDIKTSNKSFLKMAKYLKDKGVKNNKFMLELYDESLSGINPWSNDLTKDQQMAIYLECCRNFWYYIREVIRVPVSGANIKYNLHLGNLTTSYLRLKNKNQILEMPRQVGKTIGTIIFDTWAFNFSTKNSRIVYMHKDTSSTGVLKNIKDFGEIAKSIPSFLRKLVNNPKDTDNIESKVNVNNNNTLSLIGNPMNIEEADKRGRGVSTPIVFIDEFAFVKFFSTIFKSLGPAWKQASIFAKQNNVPYGLILATTPGDPESETGKFALSVIDKALKWRLQYFDLSEEDLDETLNRNSQNDFFYLRFDHIECGKDDKFIQEAIRLNNGDMLSVRREYLLEWLTNFNNTIFTQQELMVVKEKTKPPVLSITVNQYYIVDFYEQPNFNLNYIIGCDVSGGLANDYSTMVMCHPDDFRVVGVFANNHISVDDFTDFLIQLSTLYFRNSILVVERNSYGLIVLDRLIKIPLIEKRLFRTYEDITTEKKTKDGFAVKETVKKWRYGQQVTKNVRDAMMDLLSNWVQNHPEKIISESIYKELSQLKRDKYGKIQAPEKTGYHDDILFGLIHILYACLQTKYMKQLFGIRNIVGSPNAKEESSITDISMINRLIDTANTAAVSKNIISYDIATPPVSDDNEVNNINNMLTFISGWNK